MSAWNIFRRNRLSGLVGHMDVRRHGEQPTFANRIYVEYSDRMDFGNQDVVCGKAKALSIRSFTNTRKLQFSLVSLYFCKHALTVLVQS